MTRSLNAFLCHASGDKPAVREMYTRLTFEGVDAWLDKEKLLPGQDWRVEIPRAVQEADVIIVFLSKKSISKEGYIQKEIKFALDIAEEKPEGSTFTSSPPPPSTAAIPLSAIHPRRRSRGVCHRRR